MIGARAFLLIICASTAWPQAPAELYRAHCAGCHGPAGEGSRGPALKVAALKSANDLDSLISLLRRGVPGTEMPAIATSLINDQQIRGLASFVLAFRTATPSAAAGPAARGAALFRTKGNCLNCHRLNGEGKPLGPDLSGVGGQRDKNWLRRAILDPQAEIYDSFSGYRWTIQIPDNYLLVELATKQGEKITGARLNEDAFSIQIRDGDGRIRSFLKSEVAELKRQWGKSPMPSYKDVLSAAEVDDLVAYLASLGASR